MQKLFLIENKSKIPTIKWKFDFKWNTLPIYPIRLLPFLNVVQSMQGRENWSGNYSRGISFRWQYYIYNPSDMICPWLHPYRKNVYSKNVYKYFICRYIVCRMCQKWIYFLLLQSPTQINVSNLAWKCSDLLAYLLKY